MLLDHSNRILGLEMEWMKLLGRSAYPLFAFILVYNYIYHTRNALHYLSRLLILGVVSQGPYALAFPSASIGNSANIMFSLGASLFAIIYLEYIQEHAGKFDIRFKWLHGYIYMLMIAYFGFVVSYMYFGLFMTFCFYFLIRYPSHQILKLVGFSVLILNFPGGIEQMGASVLSLLLISLVLQTDIKIKRINKHLFYFFYPAHLILLLSLATIF